MTETGSKSPDEYENSMPASARALFPRLLDIVRDAARRTGSHCTFTSGDFSYRWATEAAVSTPVRIWRGRAGSNQGFVWLSGDHLHLVHGPGDDSALDDMIFWGEATARRSGEVRTLHIPVRDKASALRQRLEERGYERSESTLIQRSRSLRLIPAAHPPTGYVISSVEHRADLDGWSAAYRQAFAPEPMSLGLRLEVSRNPLYREELDLIARDPGGRIVAFALAWFDDMTGAGTFEPLGCVPDHRREGLTRHLMIEGMKRLGESGAQAVFVATTRRRVPANLLYEGLGFKTCNVISIWRKPMMPPGS